MIKFIIIIIIIIKALELYLIFLFVRNFLSKNAIDLESSFFKKIEMEIFFN